MNKLMLATLALAALAASAAPLLAQEQGGPPKVLVVDRETVKFGGGAGHERNEAAFARAYASLKRTDHYLAATSMSGPDEALFFSPFDSLAEWEAANKQNDVPNAQAFLGPLMEKDADFVSEGSQIVLLYNEKWSYRASVPLGTMRYFEIEHFQLRPGHRQDWEALVALYKSTAEKINLDEHDAFFEAAYGAPDDTVVIITPRKSLAEVDAAVAGQQTFTDALGTDGRKKLSQLEEAAVEPGGRTDLFRFAPSMSYPTDAWVQADPAFWKPRPAAKPAAKAAAKPAAGKK